MSDWQSAARLALVALMQAWAAADLRERQRRAALALRSEPQIEQARRLAVVGTLAVDALNTSAALPDAPACRVLREALVRCIETAGAGAPALPDWDIFPSARKGSR